MPKIRCVLIDIDGVMSPDKIYDKSGLCIGKTFADKDWTAIKRLKARNILVLAVTGDPWNEEILANRNIGCINSRGKDKESFLPIICKDYHVSPQEIAYIGDDIFDVGLLREVSYPFAPCDAAEECFTIGKAENILVKGGDNCLMRMFEILLRRKLIPTLDFNEEWAIIKQLDKNERF